MILNYEIMMVILKIDDILRQKGMSEKDLASKMGISVQAVNSVVRCRENPSVKKLKKYADALGVGIGELFESI